MGSVNKIIKKCPSIIKRLYYKHVPFEKRYGRVFTETFNSLMESRSWSRQRLLDFQYEKFKEMMTHCYNNVPYYKKVMDERGLLPESFKSVEDISLMPILTKDIIRENFNDLIASNMKHRNTVEFRTSGSTGKKLIFLGTDDVFKKEAAFVLRAFKDHGATMYDKPSVWLRRYVPKDKNSSLYHYDHELRRLYMSAYHLNNNTVKEYVDQINSKKYHTLVGYPSSIFILACLCEEVGIGLDHIQAIHVASEKMLAEWSEKIEAVFGITPKAHYGMQEKVVFHHQTADHSMYYENLEYGVTELVDEQGQNVIVGTGFINKLMPFIRYKTSDVGVPNVETNTTFKLIDIEGRCDDILISSDNSLLPGVNFYTMMYKIDGVKMFQIRQKVNRDVTVLIVPNDKFKNETKDKILSGLHARLGNLPIIIKKVNSIQRSSTTGKIRNIFREK
tara:strand:+ start:2717 stop:4054 length:1338 start_codon:yes stop_codon:yes gene_type:complete